MEADLSMRSSPLRRSRAICILTASLPHMGGELTLDRHQRLHTCKKSKATEDPLRQSLQNVETDGKKFMSWYSIVNITIDISAGFSLY